ncbi:hypothetical protein TIFTF001_010457 [Ficus carica]|uniref:KIB1-4 beta-propeller domain-containing protein n=1 Tax=Ficus carica TaxID=3494 RepID=A0AA88D4J3_FICCA|nr:hypothetical protein TIFTF001_010457 [Ficus carica]
MLLFPCEEADTWTIYTVMNKKFLDLKLSLSYKKNFSGSSEGWLVISNKDHTVTLHKPEFIAKNEENNQVSTTSIYLPYVSPPVEIEDTESWDPEDLEFLAELNDRIVVKALITADPLTNPDKCIIFVIHGEFNELACIRLNKDTTWIKSAEKFFEDIVHYNNKVYTVDFHGKLMSLDIAVAEPSPSAMKCVAPSFRFRTHTKRYLVESRGELFQVLRFFSTVDKIRSTRTFRVYMMDFEKEQWVEINNLGGAAFFVGDSSSTSVLVLRECIKNPMIMGMRFAADSIVYIPFILIYCN